MDSLIQALPRELITKIMWYALESPHKDLDSGYFKRIAGSSIYNTMVEYGGIVIYDGRITKISVWDNKRCAPLSRSARKELTFSMSQLTSLRNLTELSLNTTCVKGDIQHLNSLTDLTQFNLYNTEVNGDIQNLSSLQNLTEFDLYGTNVTGDIQYLITAEYDRILTPWHGYHG